MCLIGDFEIDYFNITLLCLVLHFLYIQVSYCNDILPVGGALAPQFLPITQALIY